MKQIEMWEVYVPTKYNTGKPVRTRHHKMWDSQVYKFTGGLTILKPTSGRWVHEGILYEDRCIPVRIACTRNQLQQILKFTKSHYKQIAIMAYKISDEVIIYQGD